MKTAWISPVKEYLKGVFIPLLICLPFRVFSW